MPKESDKDDKMSNTFVVIMIVFVLKVTHPEQLAAAVEWQTMLMLGVLAGFFDVLNYRRASDE